MKLNQLQDTLRCSAGTVSVVTGMRNYSEIMDFSNWMAENFQNIPYVRDCFETLRTAFKQYQERRVEKQIQNNNLIQINQNSKSGMSVEQAELYLQERGLESLVVGGFKTIQKMQSIKNIKLL